jgi:hypothetical protein
MKSKLFLLLLTVSIGFGGCKKEAANKALIPTVTTRALSGVTITTALLGGTVTNDGGTPVTFRGVCWSTSPSPTILDDKTADGVDTGTFTSALSGLKTNTIYHARAYAHNEAGTAYGNEISFTTVIVVPGDSYLGGIVAYVLQPGDTGYIVGETHGLITPPTDQGMVYWGTANTYTGALRTEIGFGRANTDSIVRVQGAGTYAAQVCNDLVLNGYDDWYLPSKNELWQLYLNQVAIGGFVNNTYWSSSENQPNWVWAHVFTTGYTNVWNKYEAFVVRAVRSF